MLTMQSMGAIGNVLDDKERNKALRFAHKTHNGRYVVSHGKLRAILASYISMAPENIRFAEEDFGKKLFGNSSFRP
jgi:4'-phosphopantetheinyl transferase